MRSGFARLAKMMENYGCICLGGFTTPGMSRQTLTRRHAMHDHLTLTDNVASGVCISMMMASESEHLEQHLDKGANKLL